ncbi:glucose-6-phosphate dehydrogenase [Flaviflexus equikiangi]|uniref:glucose-6-phosphate dehydrogenase n=1 Tax=Flaviflexus equikiangi TaxID=2758573 RepID=UPI0015F451EE|nr:glucose-6-phosphate dehydrogenase [Flaviflexus equikiangi]
MERTFIILGGAGDLARRLLLPGIAHYCALTGTDITVVGAGHSSVDDYAGLVRDATEHVDARVAERLADRATYSVTDATDSRDLSALLEGRENAILYFALSPTVTAEAVSALPALPPGITLAVEKPFGTDRESARQLNARLAGLVDEPRIVRVDHFVEMAGVRNLRALRSANRLITSSWTPADIAAIDLAWNETIGLEGRADFYDATGAAEDMLQSHLLQTVAHVLADGDLAPEDILRGIRVQGEVRKGRYSAGEVNGKSVPAYVDEDGVDPDRGTETWFRVTVEVDVDRWRGIPIRLESGKAFGLDRGNIVVTFRPNGPHPANTLSLDLLDHSMAISLAGADLRGGGSANLTLHSALAPAPLSAYGRVVERLIDGDGGLSADAAVAGWEAMSHIREQLNRAPLEEYPAGTMTIP